MTCGVYEIRNTVAQRSCVGSSQNIEQVRVQMGAARVRRGSSGGAMVTVISSRLQPSHCTLASISFG